jgi:ankyrin repeat protein
VIGAELRKAAYTGDVDAVLALIRQGADPCDCGDDGFTAIHIAAQSGNEYLTSLLEHPLVRVNAQSRNGMTTLHCACGRGRVQVVAVLLKNRADREARAAAGETPL